MNPTQLKLQDLRIGNLIKDGHDIEEISVRHLQMMVEGQAEFDPIPLTEEWLLKMGFELVEIGARPKYFIKPCGTNQMILYNFKEFTRVEIVNQSITTLKNVHQLQNLFYALTSQELTIKH